MNQPASNSPWQFTEALRIFRFRMVLRATREISNLPPYHAAVLYALVAEANGRASGEESAMPDGVLLDAPEQLVTRLEPDEPYAFGFTLLAPSRKHAGQVCDRLSRGLRLAGRKAPKRGAALGGNFRVERLEDLVAGTEWDRTSAETVEPVPSSVLAAECAAADCQETLTLRFLSPLRAHRPKQDRSRGQTYFSRDYFNAPAFVSRLLLRLHSLGLIAGQEEMTPASMQGDIEVVQNDLVWLDLKYGRRSDGNALDGALGRVTLRVGSSAARHLLALGQHVRIGESTRFGHGRYRIEQLGEEPYACHRSRSLLEIALTASSLDRAADQYELPAGEATRAAADLLAGRHVPAAHSRVTIESPPGKTRELSIPAKLDRALQRAVLDVIAGPLDLLLEDSSFAYRPGLNRDRAAARIRRAWRSGHRWALRADVAGFFDSVDHGELQARLSAFLSDDRLLAVVMRWVEAGAPGRSRGLPTGASLSPLMANLLLDQFDEQVAQSGGFLVRYSDDFLILYRDRADAERAFEQAAEAAQRLQLELNAEKSRVIDLNQPFEYLGFRFQRERNWQYTAPDGPCPLDDLGWHESPRQPEPDERPWKLPGESDTAAEDQGATVIVGPGCRDLHVEFEELRAYYHDGRPFSRVAVERVRDVVVLGVPNLSSRLIDELPDRGWNLLLANDSGYPQAVLSGETPLEDAEAISRQVALAADPGGRLTVARLLVSAKLRNYAALAATAGRGEPAKNPTNNPVKNPAKSTAERLEELAERAGEADTVESLLGIEGAGGAEWYRMLPALLGSSFGFERRVAPAAEDPVNVLLNIGYTFLYRYAMLLIRQAGLLPVIGLLHAARPGHACLASDLQEPFRHLVDRAVIEATHLLRAGDFELADRGPFKLRILPQAARRYQALLHQVFLQPCVARHESEPRAYRWHFLATVRSLKRHLKEGEPFRPFEHP